MFCINCGKEIQPDRAFCPHCGAALGHDQVEDPTQPTLELAAYQADQTTEPTLVVAAQQALAPPPPAAVVEPLAPPPSAAIVEPMGTPEPAQPVQATELAQPGDPPPPPRKRYGLYASIAGLVLVICIGAAVAAYLLLRGDGEASGPASTVPDGTIILDVEVPGDDGTLELVDLSVRASAMGASSVLESQGEVYYEPENLIDDELATCWAEGVAGYGIGEFVEFVWDTPVNIRQVRIVPGYDKSAAGWDRWISNGRVRTFDLIFSDGTTESFHVTDSRAVQSLDLSAAHTVTTVRFVITGVYEAAPGPHKSEDTSMSELHLWGTE